MNPRKLIDRGRITQELTVNDLQRMSDNVAREWNEKQSRLQRQRDENRKRLFPKLWAEEQKAKQS